MPIVLAAAALCMSPSVHDGDTIRCGRERVRIANIDVSDLSTVNAANIINALVRGLNRLPTTGGMQTSTTTSDAPTISGAMGRTVIYANRTVAEFEADLGGLGGSWAVLACRPTWMARFGRCSENARLRAEKWHRR